MKSQGISFQTKSGHPDFTMVWIGKTFQPKIMNIFLFTSFNICFGCAKEPLSTNNISFGQEIRKLIFDYAFLSRDLI